ncbi:uncharacterized protein LOC112344569 [Selaginella moellendorffii]|nr:uncharacterized protein LOC112344569 [Selaginella moellendorffii]|eukprot:XP_024525278.1 uncharacterized protein LOC112344569 [Selaginella moellendorffii]
MIPGSTTINSGSAQQKTSAPVAPVVLLAIVFALLASPLYTDDVYLLVASQLLKSISLLVLLVPLFLLLAVQLMSLPASKPAPPSKTVPFSEVGGSPVGLAFMVVFILAVIWWQPGF